MSAFWAQAAALVWGPATVVLLLGTGIYLSTWLRFIHLRNFFAGFRLAARGTDAAIGPSGPRETSHPCNR